MIIQCAKCSTKFRLDDSLITGSGVKVRCTKCQEVFVVAPPEKPAAAEAKPAKGPEGAEGAKEAGGGNVLRFDFERPAEREKAAPPPAAEAPSPSVMDTPAEPTAAPAPSKAEETPEGTAAEAAPAEKPTEDTKPEAEAALAPQAAPEPPAPESPASAPSRENLEFKFDEGAPSSAQERLDRLMTEEPDFKFGEEPSPKAETAAEPLLDKYAGAEPEPETASEPEAASEPKAASKEKPPAREEAKAVGKKEAEEEFWKKIVKKEPPPRSPGAAAPAATPSYSTAGLDTEEKEPKTKDEKPGAVRFEDLLSRTISEPEKGPLGAGLEEDEGGAEEKEGAGAEEKPAVKKAESAPGVLSYAAAAVIIIVGGLFIYMTGLTDAVTRAIVGSGAATARTVEIASLKGYGAENKGVGQVFIIEGTIKNLTDKPQPIKSVRGAIYDGAGKKLAERTNAPGRVFQPEDIKAMAIEDLTRQPKDPAGAVLPPRGTLPVMVLFDKPPQGSAEVGLEVVR